MQIPDGDYKMHYPVVPKNRREWLKTKIGLFLFVVLIFGYIVYNFPSAYSLIKWGIAVSLPAQQQHLPDNVAPIDNTSPVPINSTDQTPLSEPVSEPTTTQGLVPTSTPDIARGGIFGKVDVGPICPVEREDMPCPVPPAAYTSRSLIVNREGAVFRTVQLLADGTYRIELPPGSYELTLGKQGIDSSSELPYSFTLKEGETLEYDISIDTGMR